MSKPTITFLPIRSASSLPLECVNGVGGCPATRFILLDGIFHGQCCCDNEEHAAHAVDFAIRCGQEFPGIDQETMARL